MGRNTVVTDVDVAQAVSVLENKGLEPNAKAVKETLGCGSNPVIKRLLAQYNADRSLNPEMHLPAELISAFRCYAGRIADEYASTYEAVIKHAGSLLDEADAENKRLQGVIADQQKSEELLKAQLAKAELSLELKSVLLIDTQSMSSGFERKMGMLQEELERFKQDNVIMKSQLAIYEKIGRQAVSLDLAAEGGYSEPPDEFSL